MAIGNFKFIGFLKTINRTRFCNNDTQIFSPLCLFIALLSLIIFIKETNFLIADSSKYLLAINPLINFFVRKSCSSPALFFQPPSADNRGQLQQAKINWVLRLSRSSPNTTPDTNK